MHAPPTFRTTRHGGRSSTRSSRAEQHIVAVTAQNRFTLGQELHRQLVDQPGADFATLNTWIYEHVFATPKADPRLDLNGRTDFTGLPGDGVVMP